MAGVCHIQGAKFVKCNKPHLTIHHCHFTWYYKANDKLNPPRLETKKGKLCPHSFKCLNYKGNYQVNSVNCPFWKHHFNKKWHSKEYSELQETKKNSIHLDVNANMI